jgi:hypothetical protein
MNGRERPGLLQRCAIVAMVACLAWNVTAGELEKPESAPNGALTSGGTFYVTWSPDPDPIPINELFKIRFEVYRADDRRSLVPRAVVTANAWMPEHNHGTSLQPRVESHGDGTATGKGFLLHMQGRWELRIGVALDGQMERATFGFLIEP